MFFGLYLTFGFLWRMIRTMRRCGGIGRHKGLKIPRWKHRTGSTPVSGTNKKTSFVYWTKEVFLNDVCLRQMMSFY